jgi:hypothetical protein
MSDIVRVKLLKERGADEVVVERLHAVAPPPSITEQEEIFMAYRDARRVRGGKAMPRAAAALVGLCTRIGRESGVTYAECGFDPLAYGGRVLDWIRLQPGNVDGLVEAAEAIYPVLVRSITARNEAATLADFSAPRAGPSTAG